MNATTTFVLALVAIVVSVPSAIASVWAVRQTAKYHPKPLIVGSLTLERTEHEQSSVSFKLYNRGNATAHDLTAWIRHKDAKQKHAHYDEFAPSDGFVDEFLLPDQLGVDDLFREHPPVLEVFGMDSVRDMYFSVTWRQAPNMEKLREREFKIAKP